LRVRLIGVPVFSPLNIRRKLLLAWDNPPRYLSSEFFCAYRKLKLRQLLGWFSIASDEAMQESTILIIPLNSWDKRLIILWYKYRQEEFKGILRNEKRELSAAILST
jgi:hypothetical protein